MPFYVCTNLTTHSQALPSFSLITHTHTHTHTHTELTEKEVIRLLQTYSDSSPAYVVLTTAFSYLFLSGYVLQSGVRYVPTKSA